MWQIITLTIVLTYSDSTAQYSLSEPMARRMKKAPERRSISPTSFIPARASWRRGGVKKRREREVSFVVL